MTFKERKLVIERLCMGGSVAFRLDPEGKIVFWEGDIPKPTEETISIACSELESTLVMQEVAQKLEELANSRFLQETGGLTLSDGTVIKTDRESQALLTGASLYALQNPMATVEWKGANGWVTLTAEQIQQIAMAVRSHVQAAFSREKDLAEKVEAAETAEEVNAVSW